MTSDSVLPPGLAPSAESICPGCEREVAEARCGYCGAALAPGGYRVERVLANTPHGRVYRARSPDGHRVALKELHFGTVPTVQELDAFEREAKTLASLDHPQIPRFVASFSEGVGVHTRLYLASEFIEGESLAARVDRGTVSGAELEHLARRALNVLSYLHGRHPRVVHRDVKPENLILRGEEVVLVDFGSARWLSSAQTYGSTLVGTFGYMPPEQLGGTVQPSSDLYALGATLLFATTGVPPIELIGPDFSLRLPDGIPDRMRPLLEAMLQPNLSLRVPSAEKALELVGVERIQIGTAQPVRARSWGRLLGLGGLIACAILLLAIPGSSASKASDENPLVAEWEKSPQGRAREWFYKAERTCTTLEAPSYIQAHPPPEGPYGTAMRAKCLLVSGDVASARKIFASLTPAEREEVIEELAPNEDKPEFISVQEMATLNLITDLTPENAHFAYARAKAEYLLGRTDLAKKHLRAFLKTFPNDRNAVDAKVLLDRLH